MLTQNDSDKINTFYHSIIQEFGKSGIPVRNAGDNEERCVHTGDVYLTLFLFQIGMERFTLFVNNNMTDDSRRYGWYRG